MLIPLDKWNQWITNEFQIYSQQDNDVALFRVCSHKNVPASKKHKPVVWRDSREDRHMYQNLSKSSWFCKITPTLPSIRQLLCKILPGLNKKVTYNQNLSSNQKIISPDYGYLQFYLYLRLALFNNKFWITPYSSLLNFSNRENCRN